MRTILIGLLALTLAACGGGAGDGSGATASAAPATERQAGGLSLKLVKVAGGFELPVYLTFAPGQGGRLYVVEQGGRIRVIANGRIQRKAFLDIRNLTDASGEQGLLSMAFHPNYAKNRLFYVDYTNLDGDTVVAEYRWRASGAPVRVRQILFVNQPYPNHNGGQLQFGPDGFLYVGMGDGGSGGDPQNRAQNLSTRLGKLLRIDVNDRQDDWEIVGYGLRNPWRFAFDRATGDLYIADVGQGDWEEIDVTPPSSPGLENYGWDVYEGTHVYEDKDPSGNGQLAFPVYEYSHSEGCSVTGGYVYRGSKIPAAKGRYFFGDYCSGTIWSFALKDGKATDVRTHSLHVDVITSFGEGRAGELYVVSHEGDIFRIAPR